MRTQSRVLIAGMICCVAIALTAAIIGLGSTLRSGPRIQAQVSANASVGSPVPPARSIPTLSQVTQSNSNDIAPAPSPGSQDQDALCRDRLAARGIYLQAGNPCFDIDTAITKLAIGTYKFNKPESAYVDEPFTIVLSLTTADDQDVSSAFTGTQGTVVEREGRFAQHLEATLRGGTDFKVEPSGPQERTATSLSPVLWEWAVTPINRGTKTIVIEVTAKLIMGAQNERVQIRTLQEPIEVRVGMFHLVSAALSSVWGIALGAASMIGAVLGLLHHLSEMKQRRRRANK